MKKYKLPFIKNGGLNDQNKGFVFKNRRNNKLLKCN